MCKKEREQYKQWILDEDTDDSNKLWISDEENDDLNYHEFRKNKTMIWINNNFWMKKVLIWINSEYWMKKMLWILDEENDELNKPWILDEGKIWILEKENECIVTFGWSVCRLRGYLSHHCRYHCHVSWWGSGSRCSWNHCFHWKVSSDFYHSL